MRKITMTCLTALLTALILAGCGGFDLNFTFSFTNLMGKTTVEIKDAEDGETAQSDYVSVGKGRAAVIESALEKGRLQIDIAEAEVYTYADDDTPADIVVGDVVESITVGPGDTARVSLEKGDYVYLVTAIGETSGKVVIDIQKE
ncbi:MAG: hypothetical protein ACSW8K_01500 [bacterium]